MGSKKSNFKEADNMKLVPKVQNWEVLDDIRGRGSSLRNYRSVGLHRGWEDVLIGSVDRKIEQRRKRLEDRVQSLTNPQSVPQSAV
jgi:hypothetical protein